MGGKRAHLDQVLCPLLPREVLLKVVEEVDEGVEGDHPGLGRVHTGRVVEDAGRGHGVEHFLLLAAALEVGQIHGAVAGQGAYKNKIEFQKRNTLYISSSPIALNGFKYQLLSTRHLLLPNQTNKH